MSRLFQLWRRRETKIASVVLLLVVVGFVGWLSVRAFEAKSDLEQARESAQQAKEALLNGDVDSASRWADNAVGHAQSAYDAAHSVPWDIASALPWIGGPFKTGQQISDVVLGLATTILRPAADVGNALSPDRLLQNGRIDVDLLREQEPKLFQISVDATLLAAAATAISEPSYSAALTDARAELQRQTLEITGLLRNTALAARIVPSLMGADGPRTYFMGFQTNAEARGTGGLLGGFGQLRFDDGQASVDDLGSNTELTGPFTPIDLGAEYNDQYGYTNPTVDYRNSNQSPHFPYTAQIWKSLWEQQTGTSVDGVIAIDPVALGYILGAVGSVTIRDGEVITAENVVELTESTAYVRFPTDQTARKNYLQEIANAVVSRMTGTIKSPAKLLEALGHAVNQRRIAVWSANPEDQALLEQTPLAHIVPDDAAPYAAVVVNNLAGNKLDYYLAREIEYAADGCSGDTRMSTVTVRLSNKLEPGTSLTEYVAGSAGILEGVPLDIPNGTMVTSVRLIATKGATLDGVLSSGQRVPAFSGAERGHPVYEVQVAIPPGQSGELTFRLTEPVAAGAPRVPIQPLIDAVKPTVSVPAC